MAPDDISGGDASRLLLPVCHLLGVGLHLHNHLLLGGDRLPQPHPDARGDAVRWRRLLMGDGELGVGRSKEEEVAREEELFGDRDVRCFI